MACSGVQFSAGLLSFLVELGLNCLEEALQKLFCIRVRL